MGFIQKCEKIEMTFGDIKVRKGQFEEDSNRKQRMPPRKVVAPDSRGWGVFASGENFLRGRNHIGQVSSL